MRRFALIVFVGCGLLASCESVCGCPPALPPSKVVYGRVEAATGIGVPTAVVLYRIAFDTVCVFDEGSQGEIDVRAEGWFRGEVYPTGNRLQCLELRAFDPAAGETDTTSILLLADFANYDSIGVVLRLP